MQEQYQSEIGRPVYPPKIQAQHQSEIDRAVGLSLKRDYGQAMYIGLKVYAYAAITKDTEAKKKAAKLLENLDKLAEMEFEEFAKRKGLQLTPENKRTLLRQHSKHWLRFDSFMRPGGMEQYGLRYVKVPLTLSPN